ncbi:MAG: hypothetical protein ACYC7E_21235 [Armatimonadota bacterium]
MQFLPDALCRVSLRIAQAAVIALIFLVIASLTLLGLAQSRFAKLQDTLAPLIETSLEQVLGRDVHIGSVQLSGLGSVTIKDASIAQDATFSAGTAISAPSTTARINLLQLLVQGGKNPMGAVSQVVVQRPRVSVNRSAAGRWDFQDVLDRLQNKNIAVNDWHGQVVIRDGNVNYHDARGLGASTQPLNQQIVGVNARVSPDGRNNYQFTVAGHDPARRWGHVQLAGYYQSTGQTTVNLKANSVTVAEIQRYLPNYLPITFENGKAAVRLSALFGSLPRPDAARGLSPNQLTAEVDLAGIGLRLDGMTAPIYATSGRLRLRHDAKRYPRGSRLEFINVRARANRVPMDIRGSITEINLFDLRHLDPRFNIHSRIIGVDGAEVSRLFPKLLLGQQLQLGGRFGLTAEIRGRASALRIAGKLSTERFGIFGLSLGGATTTFQLSPAGGAKTPTIRAQAEIRSAKWDNADFSGLRVNLASHTPWRQLNDHPKLTGSISAERGSLPWLSAKELRGAFTAGRQGMTLTGLRAQLLGGQVDGNLTVPFQPGGNGMPRTLRADADYRNIDLRQLARMLHLPEITGIGQGTLTLNITPESGLTLATRLLADDVQYLTYRVRQVDADLRVAQGTDGLFGLAIPRLTADTEYGRFTITDGTYAGTDGNRTLILPISGERIPLELFAPGKIEGLAGVDGMVTGAIDAPRLTANVTATSGAVLGRAFQEARAEMTLDAQRLRFRNIVLSRDGIEMEIPGGPDGFDPREELTGLAATARLRGAPVDEVLELFGLRNPWPIRGGAYGEIDLILATGNTRVGGSVSVPDAVVHIPTGKGAYPLKLDTMGLTFDYARGIMHVRRLQLDRGETVLLVDGSVGRHAPGAPVRADLSFRGGEQARLQDLPLDLLGVPVELTGPVTLQGTLAGVPAGDGPEPLTVSVSAAAPRLGIEGLPAGTGEIALTYGYRPQQRELTITRGQIVNAAFRASARGAYHISRGTTEAVSIDVDHIDLSALQQLAAGASKEGRLSQFVKTIAALPNLSGAGEVHLTGAGGHEDSALQATLAFSKLALRDTPLPDVHGKITLPTGGNNRDIVIDEIVADGGEGQGTARLAGTIGKASGLDLTLALRDITAQVLAPWVGNLPFDGKTTLAATVRGPWNAPVMDADVSVAQPAIRTYAFDKLAAHLHLGRDGLQLTDGRLWLTPGSTPVTIAGHLPATWQGGLPKLREDGPLSLSLNLPRQSLDVVRGLLPANSTLQGTVEAALQVGGTLRHPFLSRGNVAVAGSAALPFTNKKLPNLVSDIDLRASLSGDGKHSRLTITQGAATFDRLVKGKRPKDFQPGWVATSGSVTIPAAGLRDLNRWQWDVYAQLNRLPLAPPLSLVPHITGYLHLGDDAGHPLLTGVMYVAHSKVYVPTILGNPKITWGPFAFNPRLSVVLQVGPKVKLAKSIIRIPLRETPLSAPPISTATEPTAIQQDHNAFDYNAAMLAPGTQDESSGSWGVLTGSMNDPRLYMRFEVAKERLPFPLSLIGSVRRARGHVTFSLADGIHLAMGIPEFPEERVAAQANADAVPAPIPENTEPAADVAAPPTPDAEPATPAADIAQPAE